MQTSEPWRFAAGPSKRSSSTRASRPTTPGRTGTSTSRSTTSSSAGRWTSSSPSSLRRRADLPSESRCPLQPGQVAVQDGHRCDPRARGIRTVLGRGACGRLRPLQARVRSARALPAGRRRRPQRSPARPDRRPGAECEPRDHGARHLEDGSSRLSQGSPPHRSAPPQGPDRMAGMAGRGMARHAEGEGSGRGGPSGFEAAERLAEQARRPHDAAGVIEDHGGDRRPRRQPGRVVSASRRVR